MNKEELKKLILDEKNSTEDRGRMTPLAIFANELSHKISKNKEDVEHLLADLSIYFDNDFSPRDMITLSCFIQDAKFKEPETIFSTYFNWLQRSIKHTENGNIEKRAEILVLLSNLNYPFTKSELMKEMDIKNHFFWLWVKAMRNIGCLDEIILEIPNQINKPGQLKSLLAMLPSLLREYNKDGNKLASFGKTWYDRLDSTDDKKILEDWFLKKGINLDIELPEKKAEFFNDLHSWESSKKFTIA